MTQLTYTIAHIKIGAEDYWTEVEGVGKTGDYTQHEGERKSILHFGVYREDRVSGIQCGFYWEERFNVGKKDLVLERPIRRNGQGFNGDVILPKKGNIFQEYARTGIIENDLYKQFFK